MVATAILAMLGLLAAVAGLQAAWIVVANAAAVATATAAWLVREEQPDQSDLIAEVSHELRTPLTGILGTLELLTDSTIPLEPSEVDELLITAHSDANHLLHVVGNMHARSRLDRAVLTPDAVPTNLRSIVGKAVSRSPQVANRCYLSPGDQAVAVGDPQLLMQIVNNLVQNIERYAPDGEVRVNFDRTGDLMTVSFQDSGPGIPVDRAERIFDTSGSTQGLGLGLTLSRQLAIAMGGDLLLDNPGQPGATFTLRLRASDEIIPVGPGEEFFPGDRSRAHSPRARLLVDLAEALVRPSLDQVVGGINKVYRELLGATGAVLFVPGPDGGFSAAGPYSEGADIAAHSSRELEQVITEGSTVTIDDVNDSDWGSVETLGGHAAMLLPVHENDQIVAIFAVGWKSVDLMPSGNAVDVAEALAEITASAIARAALSKDILYERQLRSSVLDELPIAVSVFAGEPPRLVDWNRKERELLGIDDPGIRPTDLGASQNLFDVRFADGTPLTVDNAPVTQAIRTGQATGPFILLVRRIDGSQTHTRTYCAPFFNSQGEVAGAVVTSEPMDLAVSPSFENLI
jgi:K+-sensing histidine kinase KdpD